MKVNILLILAFLGGMTLATAQQNNAINGEEEFDYSAAINISLKEVSFWAPNQGATGWIEIRDDLDQFDITDSGTTNDVWLHNGGSPTVEPAAYVSGYTARTGAAFDLTFCAGMAGTKVYVKAENPQGYNLPSQELTLLFGEWHYFKQPLNQPFPQDTVSFWQEFELAWYWKTDLTAWQLIDTSKNPLYVTHDVPILGGPVPNSQITNTKAFHSLLYLGCKNAMGESGESNIVNSMYQEFLDQQVIKAGGTNAMTYWGPIDAPQPSCWSTAGLLEFEDGRCGAWADFFNDMIRVQGIANSEIAGVDWNYILSGIDHNQLLIDLNSELPSNSNVSIDGYTDPTGTKFIFSFFFVKDWDFTNGGIGSKKLFFDEDDQNGVSFLLLSNGNRINWVEETGTEGQGNQDPMSIFENHAIVKYGGDYYDPSYGTPIAVSKNDWENASLDGFGAKLQFFRNENGQLKEYRLIWFGHSNSSSLQSNINP